MLLTAPPESNAQARHADESILYVLRVPRKTKDETRAADMLKRGAVLTTSAFGELKCVSNRRGFPQSIPRREQARTAVMVACLGGFVRSKARPLKRGRV